MTHRKDYVAGRKMFWANQTLEDRYDNSGLTLMLTVSSYTAFAGFAN